MSKAAGLKKAMGEVGKLDLRIGKTHGPGGVPMRPGTKILYWSGEGKGEGLQAWSGELCEKMPMNNSWTIWYMQRRYPSYTTTAEYSPVPKLHCWTFPEAYDKWAEQHGK